MATELSEQQIGEFKAILNRRFGAMREEIRQELLHSDDENYIELAGRVHDPEEESVADLLVDLNLASIDRHVNEIRAIDEALMRIATGNYGICIDCEQPIAIERLKANPTAKRCHICQEQFEKTHTQGKTPTL